LKQISFIFDKITKENCLEFILNELKNYHNITTDFSKTSEILITNSFDHLVMHNKVIFFVNNLNILNSIYHRRVFRKHLEKSFVFTYSKYFAQIFQNFYKIPCHVQHPYFKHDQQNTREFIIHNLNNDLDIEFPNEKVKRFEGFSDIYKARILIHRPNINEDNSILICAAHSLNIPIITELNRFNQEFIDLNLSISENSNLSLWINKAKNIQGNQMRNNYDNLDGLIKKIEQNIQTTKNYSKLPQMADLLMQEQHRQTVTSRNNRNMAQFKPANENKPIIPDIAVTECNPEKILITGAIGDFLAIESMMTDFERENIKEVYYATRTYTSIMEIVEKSKCFPNLKSQIPLWTDFSQIFCFYRRSDIESRLNKNLTHISDYSISLKFAQHNKGLIRYNNSSFIKNKTEDISKFDLPDSFIVICPSSPDKSLPNRDLQPYEWAIILNELEKHNRVAVVLNVGNDKIPESSKILNLSNKTTYLEGVEILKKGSGYLGIDTSFSVLATKIFNNNCLGVKSNNRHLFDNLLNYYSPQTSFEFVSPNINSLINRFNFSYVRNIV
jgi:hypothetical protein